MIDKANSLSEYGARAVALGKSDSDVVDGLNQIRGNSFNTITVDNLTCIENGATENYRSHRFEPSISASYLFIRTQNNQTELFYKIPLDL